MAVALFHGYTRNVEKQFENAYANRFMLGDLIIFPYSEQDDKDVREADTGIFDGEKMILSEDDQKIIEKFLDQKKDHVDLTLRFKDVSGMVTNGKANAVFVGYGIEEPQGALMRGPAWEWNSLAGTPIYKTKEAYPLVVGKGLAALLDCKAIGIDLESIPLRPYMKSNAALECVRPQVQMTTMTTTGQVNAIDADIVGVMDGGIPTLDRAWVTMPLPMAYMLMDNKDLSMYAVQLKNGGQSHVQGFINSFEQYLKDVNYQNNSWPKAQSPKDHLLKAQSWKDHRYGIIYVKAMNILEIFRSFVLIVVIAIGTMTVINTLIKSVSERTREIGTLRSLGFLQREIMYMFAFEGFFLAIIANVIGMILTLVVIFIVNNAGLSYDPGFIASRTPLSISFVPWTYVACAIGLCLIATLAAFYPASKAAKTNIPEALSHV